MAAADLMNDISQLPPMGGAAASTPPALSPGVGLQHDIANIGQPAPTVPAQAYDPTLAPTNPAMAREAASLVTSGLSDKIIAAAEGAKSWMEGKGFQERYQRGLQEDPYAEAFRAAHPVLSPLIGAAGMAATAPLMPAAAPTLAGRIAQGVAIGAGTGAATGYGLSPTGSARDTALGAGIGAVGGAAVPMVAGAVSPLLRGFATKLPWGPSYEQQASAELSRLIGSDVTPSAADYLNYFRSIPDVPASISDAALELGGQNVLAKAGSLARQAGLSRTIMGSLYGRLNDRDVGAGDRLISAIDQRISSGGSAYDATKQLLAQRSADARPLYEDAFTNSPVMDSPRIQAAIQVPEIKKGLAKGIELQQLESNAETVWGRPPTFNPTDYTVRAVKNPTLFTGNVDEFGRPIPASELEFSETPNLRTLDAAKRGLDAMLAGDAYRNEFGQLTQEGRALVNLRRGFVDALDQGSGGPNGAYAQARAAWGGPSHALEMIKNGESFLGKDKSTQAINDEVSSLSSGDREFYLMGVASKLRENVLGTALSGDESKALINSAGVRNRLRPIFDSDKSYNDFVNLVMGERTIKEAATPIMGGAQTAARLAEDTSHGKGDKGLIGGLMAGLALEGAHSPLTFLPYFGYRLGQRGLQYLQQPAPEVGTALARQLTRTTLPENEAILQGLQPPRLSIGAAASPYVGGIVGPQLYFNERPRGIAP